MKLGCIRGLGQNQDGHVKHSPRDPEINYTSVFKQAYDT
jgi:hypothetical protein